MDRTLIYLALLILSTGCERASDEISPSRENSEIPFKQDGTVLIITETDTIRLDVEIADTDSSRARGLMERGSLPPAWGMLFVFPEPEMQSFWMANTPTALDLIFIREDSTVVNIARYAQPFSPEPVTSVAPARFVLEVPAGFSDEYGLVAGLEVVIRDPTDRNRIR
jgi:uncharacterized membrane protein (UPF0127 family)